VSDATARMARDERIFELRALDLSHRAIAEQVQCARSTVTKVLTPSVREREREYYRANADRINAQVAENRRRNIDWVRKRNQNYRRVHVAEKAEYDRRYRAANADRIREYRNVYYEVNRERVLEWQHQFRRDNRDQILEQKRQQWAANADEVNARRRASRDEEAREKARQWRAANTPAIRAAAARRKMLGSAGMDATDRFLSVEYRKAIINDSCVYCGAPGEHYDHKTPLARGGTDHWWNLHRTCRNCNQRKHVMTHEEFLASGKVPSP